MSDRKTCESCGYMDISYEWCNFHKYDTTYTSSCRDWIKAKPTAMQDIEAKLAQLEQQIKAMQCCQNCKFEFSCEDGEDKKRCNLWVWENAK